MLKLEIHICAQLLVLKCHQSAYVVSIKVAGVRKYRYYIFVFWSSTDTCSSKSLVSKSTVDVLCKGEELISVLLDGGQNQSCRQTLYHCIL